jgi:hypothetical protein
MPGAVYKLYTRLTSEFSTCLHNDSLLNFERIGDENLVHLLLFIFTVLGSLAHASPQPAAKWKILIPTLKLVLNA